MMKAATPAISVSRLTDLTPQDVEETLKAICSYRTYALGRPFNEFARKVETAVA